MRIITPLLLSALSFSLHAADAVPNSFWKERAPLEYQSWQTTESQGEREDMLAQRPQLVVLWAGSAYAKEFHSPRGHRFAISDVAQTLRTGVAPAQGQKGMSASCWTCKGPDVPRMMAKLGEEGFSGKNFTDLGTEMGNTVGCSDCHETDSTKLTLSRPHAQKAMAKVSLPFNEQNAAMQGAQTCGQCHVTYYFQPEANNKVNIPWIFGSTADDIERYYDTRRFYEWSHPISRTPMLKARHPEFEHWSRSHHAKEGATCITCHMPQEQGENGKSFSEHRVGNALDRFDQACAGCHDSKAGVEAALRVNKEKIDTLRTEVEMLLVKAHYEAKAAWDAGAEWYFMDEPLMSIRHSQWRWDFAVSSHGLYAHNPKEGVELLTTALSQAKQARAQLGEILLRLKVEKVSYPDLSSKEAVQAAVGLDMEKLTAEKKAYIDSEIKKHWPEAASRLPHE
ncbi:MULTISPECIES: ammonia-forming cytochrome c nitrite reductase subunit c552 [Ferrimonas]|uniref:ammonia-forming cytochrome c nitrite reductase subunit c552 n=1 Tax=Ferrimonas TaxID=44011 RepID=UPI000414C826|nr:MULTISPECIES: ammonia-forming cytochrome c nitrite reductase subunit c552 [Ferrimonas]BDY05232.1 cytochrome c-552 [Ferrimonas sp. YFM]